jgi:hypothetical protein
MSRGLQPVPFSLTEARMVVCQRQRGFGVSAKLLTQRGWSHKQIRVCEPRSRVMSAGSSASEDGATSKLESVSQGAESCLQALLPKAPTEARTEDTVDGLRGSAVRQVRR